MRDDTGLILPGRLLTDDRYVLAHECHHICFYLSWLSSNNFLSVTDCGYAKDTGATSDVRTQAGTNSIRMMNGHRAQDIQKMF